MRYFLVFITLFSISISCSQNKCKFANKKIKKIEKQILSGDNEKAYDALCGIELVCTDAIFFHSIAEMYYYLKKPQKAQSFYFKSYRLEGLKNFNQASLSNFLKSSYQTGNYSVSNELINDNNFNSLMNANSEISSLIKKNNFAFLYKQDSVFFNPVSLSVNSNADEYFPSMPINSDVIIYTYRDRNSEFQDEDFYISRKNNNIWSKPVRLGDNINSDYREGSLSVSLDGKDLFFASCNRPDSYGGCDIYYSTLINDTLWSESYNMGSNINTKYWESQPSISADGRVLFFSSNRYGGYGGSDIWMSKKTNNFWSQPTNLGPSINTSGDEYTPFLHYDNKTFYFSSKGHNGFGGFDLYVTAIDSFGVVGEANNLGYPINTHNDESGLIVSKDGLKAYYNSNSDGNLDIYSFKLPYKFKANPVAIINGSVIDSISKLGINCNVSIVALDNTWKYDLDSNNEGGFSCSIPPESEFFITVLSNGYDFFSSSYYLEKNEYLKRVDIVLNRLNLGNKISLDNIYYEFDDYSLKKESLIEIKKFANYLILNSTLKVEIGGHTDSIGSFSYNNELSKKRAESVYNALISLGVSFHQLSYKGYGYDYPLSDEDSESGRLKNRRTEIKVIGSYE